MEQHQLRAPRAAKKARKRVGRGNASGHGTYSGRGIKGQQSRSGYKTRPGFEGGQNPLIRRLPRRRGFRNPFRVAYTPVNLRDLRQLPDGSEVTPAALKETGIVRSLRQPIKILGNGEIDTALTVRTHRVSSTARAKIEAAGGTVEELTPRPAPAPPKKAKTRKTPSAEQTDAEEPPEADESEPEEPDDSASTESASAD